jgi:hypothetical protein
MQCNISVAHTAKGDVLRLTGERSWHSRYREWTLTQPRTFDHSSSSGDVSITKERLPSRDRRASCWTGDSIVCQLTGTMPASV